MFWWKFLFALIICVIIVESDSDSSLELVHVFFRHGDRTPDKKDFYPTDPYKNYSFYPTGLGQLTNKGKCRMYTLGSFLRDRYDKFLGEIYTPEVLLSRSSDYDRTKMSLLVVLAGLWPPLPSQQWDPYLQWLPIPFEYKSKKYDYYISRPTHYCPRYVKELEKLYKSDEVKAFISKNKDIFNFVEYCTRKPMKRTIDMFDVYQNLNSEESLNLTLPDWTKDIYPEPIHTIAGTQCQFENHNDILIRLNGGRHLKYIIQDGQAKIKGELSPEGRKMYLVSGHENNLNNILAALGLFSYPHVPKYGSAVIIELHKEFATGQYGYKVFYHNSTIEDPTLMTLPGCSKFCPMDKFIELTEKYIPGNYTAECESEINLD